VENVVRFVKNRRPVYDQETMELGLQLTAQLPSGLQDKINTIEHLRWLMRWINYSPGDRAAKRAAIEIAMQMPREEKCAGSVVGFMTTLVQTVFGGGYRT